MFYGEHDENTLFSTENTRDTGAGWKLPPPKTSAELRVISVGFVSFRNTTDLEIGPAVGSKKRPKHRSKQAFRIPNRCVIYMSFDRLPRFCKSRFGLHVRPLVERRLFAGRRAAARGEHPRVMARSHPASPPPGRPLRDPSAAHLETPYGKKDERHQPSDKLGPNSGGGRGAGHPWQPFSPTVRVLNTRPRLTRPPGRGARA